MTTEDARKLFVVGLQTPSMGSFCGSFLKRQVALYKK